MSNRRGVVFVFLPGFALQKNGTPLQGLIKLKCRHGALPRAMNRTPFQGYDKKEIPAFAGMTERAGMTVKKGMTE